MVGGADRIRGGVVGRAETVGIRGGMVDGDEIIGIRGGMVNGGEIVGRMVGEAEIVAPFKVSPESGCRLGSIQTPLQTSDSRLAVKSLISLWRSDGKPYFGHDRACSRENLEPQSQEAGMRGGGQS